MFKIKKCRHKYIGRSVRWEILGNGIPMECHFCNTVFISEAARSIRLPMGSRAHICEKCLSNIICEKCKKPINGQLITAECVSCGQVAFFCKSCARKALFIDLDKQERPEVIAGKIFSLIQDLVNTGGQKQGPWARFINLFRKKKTKNPVELFPLIMNINMFFTDPYDMDEFMDGDIGNEDWWMN